MEVSSKSSVRQKVIFLLMIASIVGFVIDYSINTKKTVEVLKPNDLNVSSLLVDTARFSVVNPNYYEFSNEQMPSEIFVFLEGSAENTHKNKEIIIFEIIDEVETKIKVKNLIEEGDVLFKEDKLTSPAGNNAFERYKSALIIEADNKYAIAGIQKIVNRYLALADLVIKKNETYKVAGLIENAFKVSSDYFDISLQIKKYSPYINDESLFLGQDEHTVVLNTAIKIKKSDFDNVNIKNNYSAHSTDHNKFSMSTIKNVDRKTAYVAKKLVDKKYIYGAIKVLESFSLLSNYWGDSYDLLLGLYLKKEMDKEAESLVYNNENLDLFQFAEKAAHIFVARNDIIGAIGLLEGHKPAIENYQNYYSLKAGLYYETGSYNKSSVLYRKLLHIDYTNPIYWLGLGLSLDKLEDGKALQAFDYASYYSDNKSDVKRYIEKNIILVSNY